MSSAHACQSRRPVPTAGPAIYRRRHPERTVLYQVFQEHLESYLARARWEDPEGEIVPAYVEREFRQYLQCGILSYGFGRAKCGDCGQEFLVAFSCKARTVCPSCNTRRMVETAARLVDHLIPPVAVRQWVLALPKRLRGYLFRDPELSTRALQIFLEEIERALRRGAPEALAEARFGAIAFLHRFGASVNVHLHYHCCITEGLFCADGAGVRFYPSTVRPEVIAEVQQRTRRRVLRLFKRRHILPEEVLEDMLQWAHGGGFSVDAAVVIAASDRRGLERLLRYCARPVLALERLEWRDPRHEHLLYRLSKALPDGRTTLALTPLELIHRLVQLVPPPRKHRHRYYGVFAPNAPLRAAVAALAQADTSTSPGAPGPTPIADEPRARTPKVYRWAMLLARIYEIWPLTCARCGGPVRVIAFITAPGPTRQILAHIGEPHEPPRLHPPRGPPEQALEDPTICLDEDLNQDRYPFEPDQRLTW